MPPSASLPRDLVGQPLHKPRSSGGVGDGGEFAFLLQDDLRVAGDTAGEFIGTADTLVESADAKAIHTGDDGGECFGGGAEHVDMRIVDRLVVEPGAGMNANFRGLRGSPEGTHDVGPERTGGTEFGEFHEEIPADGKGEADLFGGTLDIESAFLHGAQIGGSGGEHRAEFLGRAGTGAVVGQAAGASRGEFGQMNRVVGGDGGHFVEDLFKGSWQFSGAGESTHGIEMEPAAHGGEIDFGPAQPGHEQGLEGEPTTTALEMEGNRLGQNVAEGALQIRETGDGKSTSPDFAGCGGVGIPAVHRGEVEQNIDRVLPAGEVGEQSPVEGGGVAVGQLLRDVPCFRAITGGGCAAHIGALTGIFGGEGKAIEHLAAVDGLEGDSLGGCGSHHLVEWSAFEQSIGGGAPFFRRTRGKGDIGQRGIHDFGISNGGIFLPTGGNCPHGTKNARCHLTDFRIVSGTRFTPQPLCDMALLFRVDSPAPRMKELLRDLSENPHQSFTCPKHLVGNGVFVSSRDEPNPVNLIGPTARMRSGWSSPGDPPRGPRFF